MNSNLQNDNNTDQSLRDYSSVGRRNSFLSRLKFTSWINLTLTGIIVATIIGFLVFWFVAMKDELQLTQFSNSTFDLKIPSSGYKQFGNFEENEGSSSIIWTNEQTSLTQKVDIRVLKFNEPDLTHQAIIERYDRLIGEDSKTYADQEQVEQSNVLDYKYTKTVIDGYDVCKVTYAVQKDGQISHTTKVFYYIKDQTIVALKIKAGLENTKFTDKEAEVISSFKLK